MAGQRPGPGGRGSRPPGLPRTLVGGVGYRDLRDFSVGPLLTCSLAEEPWPEVVRVEDLSYSPVKVVHRLQEETPPFGRLVAVGAVRRGRGPGTVTAYRWDRSLPAPSEVQARVAEAVTGVVSLDNLLVVTAALGAAPPEVFVVEIEPEVEAMGETLSPAVAAAAGGAAALVRRIALHEGGASPAPEGPLGGSRTTNGRGTGPRITPFRAGKPGPPPAPGRGPPPAPGRGPPPEGGGR